MILATVFYVPFWDEEKQEKKLGNKVGRDFPSVHFVFSIACFQKGGWRWGEEKNEILGKYLLFCPEGLWSYTLPESANHTPNWLATCFL